MEKFGVVARLVRKYVKETPFSVPVDETERLHHLVEVAGDCAGKYFTDKEGLETVFFLICDELGLDEEFKMRFFELGGGE